MKRLALAWLLLPALACHASPLDAALAQDYKQHLAPLFDHFHRNPELSFVETHTAARLAQELRAAGFSVTEGVGGTGVVALLRNGKGPMVMMRADMDGLPVEEKTGLPNASTVRQKDFEGNLMPVAHACGHDVHMTSLVGTARYMASHRQEWAGTLMLLGQPAEERVGGARAMVKDGLWQRFGKPDFALAMHVAAELEAGKVGLESGSPYSGVDTVEILIHGIGTHAGTAHLGKDPVVLGAQIVLALQTVVSRDLPPRSPGLITVGSFHAGTKSNIISDSAKLQLSVRSESPAIRKLLLDGIARVALHTARAAGIPEQLLPEVKVLETAPPTINTDALVERLQTAWAAGLPDAVRPLPPRLSMTAEDFPEFTLDTSIPSAYFKVGGTPKAQLDAAANGGPAVAGHHSPLFHIAPEPAVRGGVAATVVALTALMKP
jgi:amidohydrolase